MKKLKIKILLVVLTIVSLNILAFVSSVKAHSELIEIRPTMDARINQTNSTMNYGTDIEIKVWHNTDEGFLFFDLNPIVDKNYTSATLRIDVFSSTLTPLTIYPVVSPWDENTITWLSPVSINTSISVSATLPVRGGYHYINITSIVSNWTTGIIPNSGLNLKSGLNGLSFYSKEHVDESRHPVLQIEVIHTHEKSNSILGFEINLMIFCIIGVISLISRKRIKIKR